LSGSDAVTATSIGINGKKLVLRMVRLGTIAALSAVAVVAGLSHDSAAAQNARVTAVSTTSDYSETGSVSSSRQNTHMAAVSGNASSVNPSEGSGNPAPAHAVAPRGSRLAGRYFVDFRSRTAASYGHAFIWYGRLNEHGKVGAIEVAGLHPATDSVIPYILGHIIPVPSETGKSYGDLDEQYLTANYRVYLSEADAKKVFAYIQHMQSSSPLWLASVYNCVAFIADVAKYLGLKTPPLAVWMYPEDFVNKLRDLNGGRQEVVLASHS
jgi:hypothetical protein